MKNGLIYALFTVGCISFLAWPSLMLPFDGDAALFCVIAKELHFGKVLYLDQYEITNPGIIWFYQITGSFFGFSEIGIRRGEIIYWSIFVLSSSAWIRKKQQLNYWPMSTLFYVVFFYFASGYASPHHLTKTEGIVLPLMFFAIVFFCEAFNKDQKRYFEYAILSGLFIGFVLLFKLFYSVIFFLMYLGIIGLEITYDRRLFFRMVAIRSLGLLTGLSFVLLPTLLYFYFHSALEQLLQTLFVMPTLYLKEGRLAESERLIFSFKWFLLHYSVLSAIALAGFCFKFRLYRDRESFAFLIAIFAAMIVFILQRLSWWSYQTILTGGLIGCLASTTWPTLIDFFRFRLQPTRFEKAVGLGILFVCLLPVITPFGRTFLQVALSAKGGFSDESRRQFRNKTFVSCRLNSNEAVWFHNAFPNEEHIYVFGNPELYLETNTRPALRINTWSLELYPKVLRQQIIENFATAPPKIVYVDHLQFGYDMQIQEKLPELHLFLLSEYTIFHKSESGTWWVLR